MQTLLNQKNISLFDKSGNFESSLMLVWNNIPKEFKQFVEKTYLTKNRDFLVGFLLEKFFLKNKDTLINNFISILDFSGELEKMGINEKYDLEIGLDEMTISELQKRFENMLLFSGNDVFLRLLVIEIWEELPSKFSKHINPPILATILERIIFSIEMIEKQNSNNSNNHGGKINKGSYVSRSSIENVFNLLYKGFELGLSKGELGLIVDGIEDINNSVEEILIGIKKDKTLSEIDRSFVRSRKMFNGIILASEPIRKIVTETILKLINQFGNCNNLLEIFNSQVSERDININTFVNVLHKSNYITIQLFGIPSKLLNKLELNNGIILKDGILSIQLIVNKKTDYNDINNYLESEEFKKFLQKRISNLFENIIDGFKININLNFELFDQ